jgi:nitrate/TMAO reductase-like tetraheme cytochrome c subunit
MKYFVLFLVVVSSLFGAKVVEVDEQYQKSQSCKACHLQIVKDWDASWHAKSHYESDEYFKASIDYVSRKTRKSLNAVKVECATCHNPRISVTKTGEEYEIMAVMELDKGSKVNKALKSDAISEGINCVVCHNIDKIHEDQDESKRGINRVEWTKSGTMTGPFNDAKSPYHKTEQRDFMSTNSDKLCFVCHANDKSEEGFVFTNMQSEFVAGEKKCVDCHMGSAKIGVAATLKTDNGKAKQREIREHSFAGGHMESMWKDALGLELTQGNGELMMTISNPQPHNIPSGFGSRELVVELSYKKDATVLDTKNISLTQHYTSKRDKATIAHLATEASGDVSIPAKGKKVLKVPNLEGATSVEVKLYYRLVNDEVRSILELKDPIWSRKSFITSQEIKLK